MWLIDAKTFIKKIAKYGAFTSIATTELVDMLYNEPTIEAEPVKRGRWIEKPFLLGTSNFCSLCDSFYGMPHGKFNYCPNCGAKMDKGDE